MLVSLLVFTLLLGLAAVSAGAIAATLQQTPIDAPVVGFHVAAGDDEHMAAARSAGGEFVVVVFKWADIEPTPGYFYWEVPDAALRAAQFYNLNVIARLDHPPVWALDEGTPTPWDLDAYAAFVREATTRYGADLAGVILANEPNLALEWNQERPSAVDYADLLKTLYPTVKEVAPELPVAMAGLAFTEGDAQNVNDLSFMREALDAGAADYFDVLAVHPYGFGRPPDEAPAADRLNFRRLELHRALLQEAGGGDKPLWITEMGWRTRAPNPADAWQVVSPAQQARYVEAALSYGAANRNWLPRMAFWQLDADGDEYGYDLWQGADRPSRAYLTLVAACQDQELPCNANSAPGDSGRPDRIEALAADTIVRLGDIGTLHPHWVHLYAGGVNFSPQWTGEFFVPTEAIGVAYDLLLETMQVDQAANRVLINGREVATLAPRTKPDPTSTWVTQHFSLPADLLRPGLNEVTVKVGLRTPAWQYANWRWENAQIRNVRLAPTTDNTQTLDWNWRRVATPGSWSEVNRLRLGIDRDVWVIGNRQDAIWQGRAAEDLPLRPRHDGAGRLFTDLLSLPEGQLASTDRGLMWRGEETGTWQPIDGTPDAYAYTVIATPGGLWAAFEQEGLWRADAPTGPWTKAGLNASTILDLGYAPQRDLLFAATSSGVAQRDAGHWSLLPPLPDDGDYPDFVNRLFVSEDEEPIVRYQDRLWRFDAEDESWSLLGPPDARDAYAVAKCCDPGTLLVSDGVLWQLGSDNEWAVRSDDPTIAAMEGRITDLLALNDLLYAASDAGLIVSTDEGATWASVEGLAPVVTDLLPPAAPDEPWLAATASGIYRSNDGARTWQQDSPPWIVLEMARDAKDRVHLATARGLWSTEEASAAPEWRQAEGMARVRLFTVSPGFVDPDTIRVGSWGNAMGQSSDGGDTLAPTGNGLETLSILTILEHADGMTMTVGTIEGLYQSRDNGATWSARGGPLAQQTVYALIEGPAEAAANDNDQESILWAGAADGLWRSIEGGTNWARVDAIGPTTVIRLGKIDDGTNGSVLMWAGTEADGLWISTDQGRTWHHGGLNGLSVYRLAADPERPNRILAATSQGIFQLTIN